MEIIEKYEVDTQGALIDLLAKEGYYVTQTTASRDIRELRLVKGLTGKGTYKYVLPEIKKEGNASALNSAITDSVVAVDFAGNMLVIRTTSGMANAIAVCVDQMALDGILGSVAGDDTIMMVVRDVQTAQSLASELRRAFSV
ncbi:MAG: arginine repressor [Clostridia bacterium]|nr:arginine repressor [Clostridia bacterium]